MEHQPERDDPYLTGLYRWWHLSGPSPELQDAVADGWLTPETRILDLGCGLGSELGWLAALQLGKLLVGVDRSLPALGRLRAEHPAVSGLAADILDLPFPAASFQVVLDRGCYHYLSAPDRRRYGTEAARVLAPGGRLLLRACLSSAGVRNDIEESGVLADLAGWRIVSLEHAMLPSDTRSIPPWWCGRSGQEPAEESL